jgi:hypothetical protein
MTITIANTMEVHNYATAVKAKINSGCLVYSATTVDIPMMWIKTYVTLAENSFVRNQSCFPILMT